MSYTGTVENGVVKLPPEVNLPEGAKVRVETLEPKAEPAQVPYFARRRYVNRRVKELIESGRLGRGGTDSTIAIAEDRGDRV